VSNLSLLFKAEQSTAQVHILYVCLFRVEFVRPK